MSCSRIRRGKVDRRGIATILVLGMLALLLVLGVSFSIMMRVERTAAGNAVSSVYSRHILQAALAQALADIDRSMTNGGLKIYPKWTNDILVSATGGYAMVRLAWGEPTQHAPGVYTSHLANAQVAWQNLVDINGVMGRYAYMAINVSGMLDASRSGGNTNRGGGVDASEINLSHLPEVVDLAKFLQQRQIHERYETLPEFAELTKGYGIASNQQPMNFVTYSRYPAGRFDGTNFVTNIVNIGETVVQLEASKSAIVSALTSSLDPAGQTDPQFVFTNLLDYIDADNIPRNLGSACTESVPMLNEIVLTGRVSNVGGGLYRLLPEVRVEWAYPFIKGVSQQFYVHIQGTGSLVNTSTTNSMAFSFSDCKAAGYVAGETNIHRTVPFSITAPMVTVTGAPGNVMTASIDVRAQITMSATTPPTTNDMVDASPFPTNSAGIQLAQNVTATAGTVWFGVGKETRDPRFNWMSAQWYPSSVLGSSLDGMNELTKQLLADAKTNLLASRDWDYPMYVSDAGRLESVGELGHLLRGTRPTAHFFQTVRLFDDIKSGSLVRPHDTVLDYFTVSSNQAPVEYGLINLNSTNGYALDAVFYDCPAYYPGNANRLAPAEVQSMVDTILSFNTNTFASFTNRSDVGKMDFRAALTNRTDLERDAVIAYSYRMCGTRQNLFLVIVSAGPASRGMGLVEAGQEAAFMSGQVASWLGFQRAVALVWRDPFPDSQGICRQFVKYYRIIED